MFDLHIIWTADRLPPRDGGRGQVYPDGMYMAGFDCACYGWVYEEEYIPIGICAEHNEGHSVLYVQEAT